MNYFSNPKVRIFSLSVILVAIFFIHLYKLKPESTYALDSFVKLVQTVSIQKNSYTSEVLFYSAKEIDTNMEMYPIPLYVLKVEDKIISPFPFNFAYFNAVLLKFISWKFLPYICLIFAFVSYFIFYITKQLHFLTLILASLGTPLLFQGLEYSENSMLLLFQALGLFFFFKEKNKINLFFSAFFLTIGIFLRLETLVFVGGFYFIILILEYKMNLIKFLKEYFYSLLGVLLPLICFFSENYLLYHHPLGARFVINQGSLNNFVFAERLDQVIHLLFLANWKIGFFGFTPIFLVALVWNLFRKNLKSENKHRILAYTLLFFLPFIAIIAPNDGVTNWGARYLNLGILPCLFLFDTYIIHILQAKNKWPMRFTYFGLFFSILILVIGFKAQSLATKDIRQFQDDLNQMDVSLHMAGCESIILYSGGYYLSVPSMLPRNAEQLDSFLAKNHSKILIPKNLIFSKIKMTPMVEKAIKIGLFPPEEHYNSLLKVLNKYYKLEKTIEGKKLTVFEFSKIK